MEDSLIDNYAYYCRLGVPRTATSEEISQAYKNLRLQCGPDQIYLETDPYKKLELSEQLELISTAYSVLRNEDSRSSYDQYGIPVDANQIEERLWLGAASCVVPDDSFLKLANIKHVISVLPFRNLSCTQHHIIPIDDHHHDPLLPHFDITYHFIQNALSQNKSGVLVHCAAGISRSSSVVIAYMMKKFEISFEEAKKRVKTKRRVVDPNTGFEIQLKLYEKMRWSLEGESEAHEYYRKFLDKGEWDSKKFFMEIENEMPAWLEYVRTEDV